MGHLSAHADDSSPPASTGTPGDAQDIARHRLTIAILMGIIFSACHFPQFRDDVDLSCRRNSMDPHLLHDTKYAGACPVTLSLAPRSARLLLLHKGGTVLYE